MSRHICHVRRWTETDPDYRDGYGYRRDLQLQVAHPVYSRWDAASCICTYAQYTDMLAECYAQA